MAEFDLIERIRRRTAQSREDVLLGIGDDAAVLQVPAGQALVAATDTLVAKVHFPEGTAAADIGWKALAVNLSDLAAMGATPAWALLNLTLPAADSGFVEALAGGFAQLARTHKLALVGGDTTQGPLSVTVTALGLVPVSQALRRAGAKVGDAVFVTGSLGDAAGGLRCLDRDDPRASSLLASPGDARETLLARLRRPQPRLAAGRALRGIASACIDVSDGLLADLGHLCEGSGVGAEIQAERVPRSPALVELFGGDEALQQALAGGDDYELCFTVPAAEAHAVAADLARLGCGATRIGNVTEGQGVRVLDASGMPVHPRRRGWEHFGA
ncbi:MAG TPA: thiamine-phosphate kinase [Rhodanobacteraceae bacterium]|nr:thiamine-phosphate kinase [Rhodanobacteraceae bacterium]